MVGMSIPDAAAQEPQHDPEAPGVAPAPDADVPEAPEREPVVERTEREVTLQRTVRYGPVIVGATVLCAVIAAIVTLCIPVQEDAEYTLAQAAGFMLVIGGAIGLLLGSVLCLILGAVARRGRGTGVAIRSDVR